MVGKILKLRDRRTCNRISDFFFKSEINHLRRFLFTNLLLNSKYCFSEYVFYLNEYFLPIVLLHSGHKFLQKISILLGITKIID